MIVSFLDDARHVEEFASLSQIQKMEQDYGEQIQQDTRYISAQHQRRLLSRR